MQIGRTRSLDMFYGRLETDHNFVWEKENDFLPAKNFEDVIRFYKCSDCGIEYQAEKSKGAQTSRITIIMNDEERYRLKFLKTCKEHKMENVLG